jgi:vacuolar protein 8
MSDEQKHSLLELGLCDVLIPLTKSSNVEVQGHSAAALSNLTSLGMALVGEADIAGDYSYFVRVWEEPQGGIRGFLLRFMASKDEIDEHIGVWTLIQLIESNGKCYAMGADLDPRIHRLIRRMPEIPDLLTSILGSAPLEEQQTDTEEPDGSEVVHLARTALVSLKKLRSLEDLERPATKIVLIEPEHPGPPPENPQS